MLVDLTSKKIGQFLKTHKLPKFNNDDIDKLNSLLTV